MLQQTIIGTGPFWAGFLQVLQVSAIVCTLRWESANYLTKREYKKYLFVKEGKNSHDPMQHTSFVLIVWAKVEEIF